MEATDANDDKPLIADEDFDDLIGLPDDIKNDEERVSSSHESNHESEKPKKRKRLLKRRRSPEPESDSDSLSLSISESVTKKPKKKKVKKDDDSSSDSDKYRSATWALRDSFVAALKKAEGSPTRSENVMRELESDDSEASVTQPLNRKRGPLLADSDGLQLHRKHPDVIEQEARIKANTLDALFNDEEDFADDERDEPRARDADPGADDPMEGVTSSATEQTAAPNAGWKRGVSYKNWPICAGRIDQMTLRCTYATRSPQLSAFVRPNKDIEYPQPLPKTAWGIFAPQSRNPTADKLAERRRLKNKIMKQNPDVGRDSDDDAREEDADTQRRHAAGNVIYDSAQVRDDEGDDEGDGDNGGASPTFSTNVLSQRTMALPASEQPWLVLIGSDEMMRAISSPFFSVEVRMVAIDEEEARFCFNRYATVWYVYEVTQKVPLWPLSMHYEWTPTIMTRLLIDTLYAHMMCNNRTRTPKDEADALGYVLASVAAFPMHATEPHLKMLTPSHVPLNHYSERKTRKAVVVELVAKRVPALTLGSAKSQGLPVVETHKLSASTISAWPMAEWLFADLEKPPHQAWAHLLSECCVPIEVISAQSDWRTSHRAVTRFFDDLYEALGKRVLDHPERLLKVAARVRLSTTWFASWFNSFDGRATDLQRLEFYAIFCASEIWYLYQDQLRQYASHVLDFPPRRQPGAALMAAWINEGRHVRSSLMREVDTLLAHGESAKTTEVSALPIFYDGDDASDSAAHLTVCVYKQLKALCAVATAQVKEYQYRIESAPAFVASLADEGRSAAQLVDECIVARSQRIGRVVTEIMVRWLGMRKTKRLIAPFDKMAPLIVQSTAVYGPSSEADTQAFYTLLVDRVPKSKLGQTFVIPYTSDPIAIRRTLKEALPTVYVLICDRLHLWSDTLLDALLDVITTEKMPQCAHLIITAHAHTLVHETGAGLLLSDLTATADLIAKALRLDTDEVSDAPLPTSFVGSSSVSTTNDTYRFWKRGLRTATEYDHEQRQQQFDLNTLTLHHNATKLPLSIKELVNELSSRDISNIVGSAHIAPVLVLFARNTTQRRIAQDFNTIINIGGTRSVSNTVQFVSYEMLARLPANVYGRRWAIVLCDLDYTGAGRPVCQQINAAFERLSPISSLLLVWDGQAAALLDETNARNQLHTIFFTNNQKSDRYEAQVHKFSMLQSYVAKHLDDGRLRALL